MTRVPQRYLALAAVIALAAFLRLYRLDEVGFGNLYYAATVKSMLTSPANFLYASFDPAGFVTVDKPPVGFWTQALFAAVLGFSGLALMLPQALAGIAAVPAIYALVARTFGAAAGLVAALVLAIMPVSVAVDRNNTIDAQLALLLLGATYATLRATESASLRWLLAVAALVGIGFNVKMAQAYLPLPALALTYLIGAPAGLVRRLFHLVAFAGTCLALSAAWIVLVDLTPPDRRPFVGSSTNNTALELALGHNGLRRLGPLGSALLPGSAPPSPAGPAGFPPGPAGPLPVGPFGPPPPQAPGPGGPRPPPGPPGPGLQSEVGLPGAMRLLDPRLAGQVSWFLPFALVGAALAWWRERRVWPLTHRRLNVLLWLAWLIPAAVFLSYGGIIHRYYLVMLAPPIAALAGIGAAALWDLSRSHVLGRLATVVAIASSAAIELNAIAGAPLQWPLLVALAVGVFALGSLGALALVRSPRLGRALCATACGGLLVAPFLWATTPLDGGSGGLPYASPDLLRAGIPRPAPPPNAPAPPPPSGAAQRIPVDPVLVRYLVAEQHAERYLAATATAGFAAPLMVATGQPVMAIGGFSGSDPILDREGLARRIRSGEVRFILVEERMRPDLRQLVRERCAEVPDVALRGSQPQPPPGQAPQPPLGQAPRPPTPGVAPPPGPPGGPMQLYDCAALRAAPS